MNPLVFLIWASPTNLHHLSLLYKYKYRYRYRYNPKTPSNKPLLVNSVKRDHVKREVSRKETEALGTWVICTVVVSRRGVRIIKFLKIREVKVQP